MKRSGDREIGRSGNRKRHLTAETRRRGEIASEQSNLEAEGIHATRQVSGHDFSRAAASKNMWALAPVVFRRVVQIIRAALREIFDETAYDRFLLRTNGSRSVASYRDFMCERDAAMAKKPRCC
jgi:hypothetical protein